MNKAKLLARLHLFIPSSFQPIHSQVQVSERKAAVLVPLLEENNQLAILLTVRSSHLRHHAGQICFPGGKIENRDNSIQATAIRETQEEIGITKTNIQTLTTLPIHKTLTGFKISPIVAFINTPSSVHSSLTIDNNEVSSVFTMPLKHILNKNNFYFIERKLANKSQKVVFIQYKQHVIWGATAAILFNLANQLS